MSGIFLKYLSITCLSLLVITRTSLAATAPTPTEPENNSTISGTTVKLAWNNSEPCPSNASCYKVEVAKDDGFTDIAKETYTNSLSYSPQNLAEGTYYWHVKAKDASGNWSAFSETKAFSISTAAQGNTTNASPSNSPSPTNSSNPSPSVSSNSGNSFTVSGSPSTINSDQNFSLTVHLSGLQPSTQFYLKGAFYKEGSTNYFGKTKVGLSWVKNSSSYSSQLPITTDSTGSFSGNIEIMPDDEDSGLFGSGTYLLKIGRYSSGGSGPTWSESVSILINVIPKPTTESKSTKSSVTPSATPKSSATTSVANLSDSILSFPIKASVNPKLELPAIAGISTSSPDLKTANFNENNPTLDSLSNKTNYFLLSGGLLFFSIGSLTLVKRLRKN